MSVPVSQNVALSDPVRKSEGLATMTTAEEVDRADASSGRQGRLLEAFATPVARLFYPLAGAVNSDLADVILGKLGHVENHLDYKHETAADMGQWGDPLVDNLTTWVVNMAGRFAEAAIGTSLDTAFAQKRQGELTAVNVDSSNQESTLQYLRSTM